MDIVNVNERDILQMINNNALAPPQRRYHMLGERGAVPIRQADWSQEEQEVQRLLLNFRGLTT